MESNFSLLGYGGTRNLKNIAEMMKYDLDNAISIAEDQIEKLATFERNIHISGVKTEKFSPFYGQMVDSLPSDETINNSKNAFIAIKTSQYLASKFCFNNPNFKECIDKINSLKLNGTSLGNICSDIYENIYCDPNTKYRSVDGSCNNLRIPAWGKSNTAYKRIVPSEYNDGLYLLRSRSSINGKELPSARFISSSITEFKRAPDMKKTQAMAIWGLFIGYDMAHTPASNMVNIKVPITCCTSDGRPLPPRYNHISCAPITIPHTDSFYNKFFQTCMNYVRSLPAMKLDCTLGSTEQMNQASHFLDGSVIYGSTEKKMKSLRIMRGGRLNTILKNGKEYPPSANPNEIPCYFTNMSEFYYAGDVRINSQPQLSVLHTVFVREHNRISDHLARINSHWDDERLFKESKKIVVAEIQHITYMQWLPRILGKKYIKILGLNGLQNSLDDTYNENTDPTISNAFATGGLPFINSMIDGFIRLYMEDREVSDVKELKEHFVKTTQSNKKNYIDPIIRGLATQNCQKIDNKFTDALIHYWYTSSGDYGMDLFSLDIQRGRDHGIPTYITFRKYCNLSEVTSFKDLRGIIPLTIINRLESVYKKIDDVDLIVGVISELPVKDAMVGPTLQCIIGEQFIRSKIGDRFFYDNQKQSGAFTNAQLKQIQKSNLARIFCDNSNNITKMQKDIFLVPDNKNVLFSCHDTALPFIDLTYWKEEKGD
ncbi:hypothetical protein PGB90_007587 [Kerria lacca]